MGGKDGYCGVRALHNKVEYCRPQTRAPSFSSPIRVVVQVAAPTLPEKVFGCSLFCVTWLHQSSDVAISCACASVEELRPFCGHEFIESPSIVCPFHHLVRAYYLQKSMRRLFSVTYFKASPNLNQILLKHPIPNNFKIAF